MPADRLARYSRSTRLRRRTPRSTRRLFHEKLEGRLLLAQTTGLFFNDPGASDGYTLFSPNTTDTTYLIDKDGNVANQWQSAYSPGLLGYLLEDGSLIRAAAPNGQGGNGFINAAGSGGLLERFDWEGNRIWEFSYDTPTVLQHHDFEVMPNGNILMIAWELKSEAEATQAGRDPALPGPGFLYPDHIVEVEPDLVSGVGGTIVWEWHVWDHLVQEFDVTKDNWLGSTGVEDHPELIDINFVSDPLNGGGAAEDWTHANGIDYNPDLDQIVLSVREFSEFWIIDHSTTTAEAASHSGGNSGKGGDLLYRWGNPQTYDTGDASDRVLFYQHDAKWILDDSPGAGNITVFNNGFGRPGTDFSTIEEIAPPVDAMGNYALTPGQAYGPTSTVWTYTAPLENFAAIISGTQRLENGNTLITYGVEGTFVEVTSAGIEVWKYVNPYTAAGMLGPEDLIPNLGVAGPGLDQLLTNFTFRAIDYPIDYFEPLAPPTVVDVLVRGTAWSNDFLNALQSEGLGSADNGYSVPVGSGDQLLSLPWSGIDQITLVFSEEVSIAINDLSLEGVNTPNYALSSLVTGPGALAGTFEATWTLAGPIDFDSLSINLNALAIRDLDDQPLNGEWDNPTSLADTQSDTYPSGNPLIGGDFQFHFNVLVGDGSANGAVDAADYTTWANNFGLPLDANVIKADFNANGSVGPADYTLWANNFGASQIPTGSATGGTFTASREPSSAAAQLSATAAPNSPVDSQQATDLLFETPSSTALPPAFAPEFLYPMRSAGHTQPSVPRAGEHDHESPPRLIPREQPALDQTELRRASLRQQHVDTVFGQIDDPLTYTHRQTVEREADHEVWHDVVAQLWQSLAAKT